MPIFRVKSVKIYTGQKKFTPAPPVAPVTNMRYGTCLCLARWFNFSCCYLLFFRENILDFFVWLHIWPYSKLYLPKCIGNIWMPEARGPALTWPPHTIFWFQGCQNTIYNTILIQQYTKYNIQDTIFRSHRCQNQLGVRSCGHCPVSVEILDG